MSNITTGGIIGLGSRLFLKKETVWGQPKANQALTDWAGYNIYNQAGSRPQKTTTPIEVSQLYPSVVRRKTILSTSSVAGSFVFSIPKEKSSDFWELITGDTGGDSEYKGDISALGNNDGSVTTSNAGSYLVFTGAGTGKLDLTGASVVGNEVVVSGIKTEKSGESNLPGTGGKAVIGGADTSTEFVLVKTGSNVLTIDFDTAHPDAIVDNSEITISGATTAMGFSASQVAQINGVHTVNGTPSGTVVTTDTAFTDTGAFGGSASTADANLKISFTGDDDGELGSINTTHKVKAHNTADGAIVAVDTQFDLTDLQGALIFSVENEIKILSDSWSLKEENNISYSFLQTQGLAYASRYDGMMAQSATINVAPDDVATVDISFIGKDELTAPVSNGNLSAMFQGGYDTTGGVSGLATDWKVSDASGANDLAFDADDNPFIVVDGSNVVIASGTEGGIGSIQKLKTTNSIDGIFDNFVDYYPSYNASLFIAKKVGDYSGDAGTGASITYQYSNGTPATGAGWTTDSNWNTGLTAPAEEFLIPFSDLSITVNNNLDFPTYINGKKTRTKPVQTTFKEVTVSMTLPYNKYTEPLVRDVFSNTSFAMKLNLNSAVDGGTTSIMFEMPEICVTGDGGLGDIPEGEITIPLTFTAYAPVEVINTAGDNRDGYDSPADKSPFKIYVDAS